jgi:hypothetical protein
MRVGIVAREIEVGYGGCGVGTWPDTGHDGTEAEASS